jgi:hypothetical protein
MTEDTAEAHEPLSPPETVDAAFLITASDKTAAKARSAR